MYPILPITQYNTLLFLFFPLFQCLVYRPNLKLARAYLHNALRNP